MTISNNSVKHPSLKFDNKELEEVKTHKHLGVTLCHNLSWTSHIDSVISSASKSLNVLHKLMYSLDRKTLETIYLTYIRPKLEYSCPLWSDINQQDITRIEQCQIRAAQIVTGAKRRTNHNKLYDEVSWPKLEERRQCANLKLMHKIVHTHEPQYLYELLPNTVNAETDYNLRNQNNMRQTFCRTEKYKNFLFPRTVKKNGMLYRLLPEMKQTMKNLD